MKVSSRCEFKLTVERSRFYALLFPAASGEDVEGVVKKARSELRKANHHCWACRYQDANGALTEKSKDDGEVGHPGKVLLEVLRKHDLEGAVLVSRIFGGVKLGVGGVARAFREAGEGVAATYLSEVRTPASGTGAPPGTGTRGRSGPRSKA